MFKMEVNLEALKKLIVPVLFPSDEDGNPDLYTIDFYVDETTNELMITLGSA